MVAKRVLITGVSGFTGVYLKPLLERDGHIVLGLATESCSEQRDTLITDLCDTAAIAAWLSESQPDHVIHLAASSHVVGDPLEFYRVNVLGTDSLIKAINIAGLRPQSIVVASSANVYGNADVIVIDENQPMRPVNHYGLSKATMELLASEACRAEALTIVRPFNYTGPGQSERFVYAKIVGAFARREPVIYLGNTHIWRDVSDVRDVCELYCRLLLRPRPAGTVNICSGLAVSLAEVIDAMSEIAGYRPEVRTDPELVRSNEIERLTGDPAKLDALVGPVPRRPIGDTLRDMYLHATSRA